MDVVQRAWFEAGLKIFNPQKQYDYFSAGLRVGGDRLPWAWMGVGLVWFKQGKTDAAETAFEKAIEASPQFSEMIERYKKESKSETETKRCEETASEKAIEKTMEMIERYTKESKFETETKRREDPANILKAIGKKSRAQADKRPVLNKMLFTPAQEYAHICEYIELCMDAGEIDRATHALAYAEEFGIEISPELKNLKLVLSIGEKLKGESPLTVDSNQLCLEGRYLLYTGHPTQAEAKIREAVMRNSRDVENWISLGEVQNRIGLEEELSETYEKILALDPNYIPALVGMTNCLEAAGATIKAEESYRRLLSLPEPPEGAFTGLSRILVEQGKFAEAEQIIRNATQYTPDAAHLWSLLGLCFFERGKYEEAFPFIQRAQALEPDNHIYQWMVELCGGILAGKIDPSDPKFARKPVPKGLLVTLVELSFGIGIQYKTYEQGPYFGAKPVRLIPPLNQYTKPSPKDPDFLKDLALGLEEARNFNFSKAEKIFREIHDAHPSERSPIFNLAVCFMQQGKLAEAETLLAPFKDKNEVDPEPLILLGHVLNEQKRFDEAYNCYTTAIMFRHVIDRYGAINLNIREIWKKRFEHAAPDVPVSPPPITETSSNQSVQEMTEPEKLDEETGETEEETYARAASLLRFDKEEDAEDLFRGLLENNVHAHNLISDKAAEILKILRPGSKSYQSDRPKDWPEDIVEAWIQHVESMLGLKKENKKEDIIREMSENDDSDTFVKGAVKLLLLYMREHNKREEDGNLASRPEETGEKTEETQFPPASHSEDLTQRLKREADEYHARGKIGQARDSYLEYLKHVPTDAEVWCRLGEMSLDAGKKQRAEREFQECLKHDPNNAHAKDRLNQLKRSREEKR